MVLLPLIAILMVVLLAVPDQYAYSKGPERSRISDHPSDNDSNNGGDRNSRDQDREQKPKPPEPKPEPRPEPRVEPKPEPSPPPAPRPEPEPRVEPRPEPRPEPPPPPAPRPEPKVEPRSSHESDSPTPPAPDAIRSEDINTERTPGIVKGHSPNAAPTPPTKSTEELRYTPPPKSNPRGSYRKDYEDIGRIWHDRSERRDTVPDEIRRSHPVHRDYVRKYKHYRFEYDPTHSYPSIYCYYCHNLLPPYVSVYRVSFLHPAIYVHYTYIDLPDILLDCDSEEYQKHHHWIIQKYSLLSTVLRDIRRA